MLPHVNSTVFLITRMHLRKCVGNLPLSLSSPPFLKDAPNSRPGEFWGPTPQCCSIPLVLILPDSTSRNAAAREGQGKYRPQRNTRNQGHCSSTLKSSENFYHEKKTVHNQNAWILNRQFPSWQFSSWQFPTPMQG